MYYGSIEELTGFPAGTVLIDANGQAWQKREADGSQNLWYATTPDSRPVTDRELIQHGPFHHLHIPGEPPAPMGIPTHYTELATRVEVIDAAGRAYVSMNASDVQIAVQDERRTIKIFHQGQPDIAPRVAVDAVTLAQFIEDHKDWVTKQAADGHLSTVPASTHDLASKIVALLNGNRPETNN